MSEDLIIPQSVPVPPPAEAGYAALLAQKPDMDSDLRKHVERLAREAGELPLETATEEQLSGYVEQREGLTGTTPEQPYQRAEISPAHHQQHIQEASFIPDIDERPAEEQDLLGEIVEIGQEAREADSILLGEVGVPPTTDKNESAELTSMLSNWEYDENGDLNEKIGSVIGRSNQANQRLASPGLEEDQQLAPVIATKINALRDQKLVSKPKVQAELASLESVPINEQNAEVLETAKAQVRRHMDSLGDYTNSEMLRGAAESLASELAERERQAVEQAVNMKIEADKLPWTMPNPQISPEIMAALQAVYEDLVTPRVEPAPGDVFKVAPPMKDFEGGRYAPQDEALLKAAGIDDSRAWRLKFTREELQHAGVFFLNRVGGGEQPIFGRPIPDSESEGGVFNVQDRTFLTRQEFEKVYRYQQEHGYGVGNHDPADVQLDMLVFAARREPRKQGYGKYGGFGGRENKYGLVRSPFVDLGFFVNRGVEGEISSPERRYRMNTTTIHLANAHPDYPGVSEMFDVAAHDQQYMSVGEFIDNFYLPPPTKQDALRSMQNNWPTARERAWVGPWKQ